MSEQQVDSESELKKLNNELKQAIDYGINTFNNMKLYKIVGDSLPYEDVAAMIKEMDTQIAEAVDSFLELRLFIKESKTKGT